MLTELVLQPSFSSLIKDFTQHVDFIVITRAGKNPLGGRSVIDYRLSPLAFEFLVAGVSS